MKMLLFYNLPLQTGAVVVKFNKVKARVKVADI
jgi:hypothetical protein